MNNIKICLIDIDFSLVYLTHFWVEALPEVGDRIIRKGVMKAQNKEYIIDGIVRKIDKAPEGFHEVWIKLSCESRISYWGNLPHAH